MSRASGLKEVVRPYYLKWFYFHLNRKNCPPNFKRCWSESTLDLGPEAKSLLPPQGDLPDLVFLPMADWYGLMQRSQQFAEAFEARGHRCIYVNPHFGRQFPKPYPLNKSPKVSSLTPGVIEFHVPLPREPVFHHRCLYPSEAKTIADSIQSLLQVIESRSVAFVVSFPVWTEVARSLRAAQAGPIVYDCHDLLEGFGDVDGSLLHAEGNLMQAADLVVFSADWLAGEHTRRIPQLAEKSTVIRNGVDACDFTMRTASANGQSVAVTVGYVGALSTWFDIEMVTMAARCHPEWNFELIGPRARSFSKNAFSKCPNVHLAGDVPYAEIPGRLAGFDVGIIPFRLMPLTMACNPVKLYEYFACGLPVVSTGLPEMQRYSNLVYQASTSVDFVRQLEAAVAERDQELRLERRRTAERETWGHRCEAFASALAPLLYQNRRSEAGLSKSAVDISLGALKPK